MAWIIFFAYLVFFCWLITVIPFFKKAGLSGKLLCAFFVVKVIAGIAYFQFYSTPANKPTSDTWKFYNRSMAETDILLHYPVSFAKDLFVYRYESSGGLFSDQRSYWNDVKDELMVKLMAVVNVFTGKEYYANIIFFNFFFLFGIIAFYRLMKELYPTITGWLLLVFLWPSFLFWCSGIHKDGLIFSALGVVLYAFYRLLQQKNIFRNLLLILFCLALTFLLRSYIVLALLPALLIGWLIHRFPKRKLSIIVASLVFGSVFIFTAKYIHPSLDIPSYVVDKQLQFKKLQGGSIIATPQLEPGFQSFITFLPSAADIAFFRPHPNEKGINAKIAFLEIFSFWLIFILLVIKTRKTAQPSIVWACWIFAFITLLIIGYTVNFSGAVVRYRSLLMPILVAPLLAAWLRSINIRKNNI